MNCADLGTPGSAGRKLIMAIWARLLDGATIEPDDDFWELGAASLTVAKAGYEVCNALGVELPVAFFYRYSSVREWEEFLSAELGPHEVEFRAGLGLERISGGSISSNKGDS